MLLRWLIYLATLAGCIVFDIAYGQWLSGVLLKLVALLPVVSFVLSLPAMLQTRVQLLLPDRVQVGTTVRLQLHTICPLPVPRVRCPVRVQLPLQQRSMTRHDGDMLPTEHCGSVLCKLKYPFVTDYLGLIPLPARGTHRAELTVLPVPVPMPDPTQAERVITSAMKPKNSGFSEHQELRLYRPGDSLNRVHWKLSAKTKKYIVRQPMEPMLGKLLLTMQLTGAPGELDDRCGRLLYFSRYLLQRGYNHRIRVATGAGVQEYAVSTEDDCLAAMSALLRCPPASEPADLSSTGSLVFSIGGGSL